MAGCYSTVDRWELVAREWQETKRLYGFSTLHTTELKHRKKQFKGVPWDGRVNLAKRILGILTDHTIGFVFVLDNQTYREFAESEGLTPKEPVDSSYGICLRYCLGFLAQSVEKENATNLQLIVEERPKNRNAATTLYDEMRLLGGPHSNLISSVELSKKSENWELQFADFLASASFFAEQDRCLESRTKSLPLLPLSMLDSNKVHYFRIGRSELEKYKDAICWLSKARRRYGKSWKSVICPSSPGGRGALLLSVDASEFLKWTRGLPVKRWFHLL